MIEEEVDEHSSDADVHPERERPARDAAVLRNAHPEPVHHRQNCEGQDDHGQNRVRRQNHKVNRPHNSLPRELRRTVLRVIGQVGNEKQDRDAERGDLAITMGDYVPAADEQIAGREQDETGEVKERVEMRKNGKEVCHKIERLSVVSGR